MILTVTGTNTGVGKTIATAALAVGFRDLGVDVHAAKPIQTGEPEGFGDARSVSLLAGVNTHEMLRYPAPLAPNLAARLAGMAQPSLDEVTAWIRSLDAPDRVVLVEGAGGLLVRLADDFTLMDITTQLDCPLVVVTTLGLGSLNLAELTVREAQRARVRVAGLIGGSLSAEPDLATSLNLKELPRITGVPLLGCVPEGASALSPARFAAVARSSIRPDVLARLADEGGCGASDSGHDDSSRGGACEF